MTDKEILDRRAIAGAAAVGLLNVLLDYGYIPNQHKLHAASIVAEWDCKDIRIKPFHQWKAEQYAKDQAAHTPHNKYWYYKQYGGYCEKQRAKAKCHD